MAWLSRVVQVLIALPELIRLVRAGLQAASRITQPDATNSKLGDLVDESSKTGDQRELEKAISGTGGEPTRHNIAGLRKRTEEKNGD